MHYITQRKWRGCCSFKLKPCGKYGIWSKALVISMGQMWKTHVTYTSQANSKPTLQVVGCNFMVKTQDRLFPNSKLKKVMTRQVFKAKQPNSICFSLKATSENWCTCHQFKRLIWFWYKIMMNRSRDFPTTQISSLKK